MLDDVVIDLANGTVHIPVVLHFNFKDVPEVWEKLEISAAMKDCDHGDQHTIAIVVEAKVEVKTGEPVEVTGKRAVAMAEQMVDRIGIDRSLIVSIMMEMGK
jgi:hypothetical protein